MISEVIQNILYTLTIWVISLYLAAMAWQCTGTTNAELVHNMFKAGLFKSERIRSAMLGVRFSRSDSTFPNSFCSGWSRSLLFCRSIFGLPPTNRLFSHHFCSAHACTCLRIPTSLFTSRFPCPRCRLRLRLPYPCLRQADHGLYQPTQCIRRPRRGHWSH